jgi:hypothetical protein
LIGAGHIVEAVILACEKRSKRKIEATRARGRKARHFSRFHTFGRTKARPAQSVSQVIDSCPQRACRIRKTALEETTPLSSLMPHRRGNVDFEGGIPAQSPPFPQLAVCKTAVELNANEP